MNADKEHGFQTEHEPPTGTEKKIHPTHFPVLNIPLRNKDYDSGYEWVNSGNGRWKRVPKKAENNEQSEVTS
jgi:hypothetical protein